MSFGPGEGPAGAHPACPLEAPSMPGTESHLSCPPHHPSCPAASHPRGQKAVGTFWKEVEASEYHVGMTVPQRLLWAPASGYKWAS